MCVRRDWWNHNVILHSVNPFSGSPFPQKTSKWPRRAGWCSKERQGDLPSFFMLQPCSQVTVSHTSKFYQKYSSPFFLAHIRCNSLGETFPSPPWWVCFTVIASCCVRSRHGRHHTTHSGLCLLCSHTRVWVIEELVCFQRIWNLAGAFQIYIEKNHWYKIRQNICEIHTTTK